MGPLKGQKNARTMKTLIARTLLSIAFFGLLGILQSHAQSSAPNRVALRVADLTSEERDSLSRDLESRGDLRISFACVPAGILILEPVDSSRSAASVRAIAFSALIARLPAPRRTELTLSTSEAEELCAAARNH
jgi:hypothetical protein